MALTSQLLVTAQTSMTTRMSMGKQSNSIFLYSLQTRQLLPMPGGGHLHNCHSLLACIMMPISEVIICWLSSGMEFCLCGGSVVPDTSGSLPSFFLLAGQDPTYARGTPSTFPGSLCGSLVPCHQGTSHGFLFNWYT